VRSLVSIVSYLDRNRDRNLCFGTRGGGRVREQDREVYRILTGTVIVICALELMEEVAYGNKIVKCRLPSFSIVQELTFFYILTDPDDGFSPNYELLLEQFT